MARVYAVPQIGTTELLYGESSAAEVIMSRLDDPKIPKAKFGIRRIILGEIIKQMSGFQALLDGVLTESGTFAVYDANQIVYNWKNTNPKLLDTFYKTTSIKTALNESANSGSKLTASAIGSSGQQTNSQRFVLLGWVDNIYEHETRTPISGTAKAALLYSMEISCEYRLINLDNNHIVAAFTAVGHGGIARILGTGILSVNYDIKLITGNMFNALAHDLYHILRVREDEYIKKKINAKKINVSMPISTK